MINSKLLIQYVKQYWRIYLMEILFCMIFISCFLLYHLPLEALVYPMLLCASAQLVFMAFDFRRVRRKHEKFQYIRTIADAIANTFPQAETIENEDYQVILRLMAEEHQKYHRNMNQKYSDMVDYYTVWAHQIKTPIASMKLQLQSEDSPLSRRLYADLHRIEQYVEMVLTFLRLDSKYTDYVLREYCLDDIIRQAVKKFSHEFIGRKIRLEYEPADRMVITDEKWLSFVIEQVLSNALKYTQSGTITISVNEEGQLSVRDTGIGIAESDLPRIFENGYTGYNGRMDKMASGIGLYLCKRICSNLGYSISAGSVVGEGTVIVIDLEREKIKVE